MRERQNKEDLSEKIKRLFLLNFAGHIITKVFVVSYYRIVGLPIILLGIIMYNAYKRRRWAIIGYLLLSVFTLFAALLGVAQVIYNNSFYPPEIPGNYLLITLYIFLSIVQIRVLLLLRHS